VRRCVSVVAVLFMASLGAVVAVAQSGVPAARQSAARPTSAAAGSAAAAEVERVERELVVAIARTDLDTYDRIVADDYVAYTVTGQESTKPEILASYRTGTRRYLSLSISDVKVRVFGETAILSARTSGTRIEEGSTPVPNTVRYFRVFTRRHGAWRAVMQMVTPLPAAFGTK
jgi:ketosteroid isomerase-like protein